MRGGTWGIGPFFLLLALAIPAAAEPGTFEAKVRLPATLDGSFTAHAQGDFALLGDAGTASLLVEGHSGKAARLVHRAFGYVSSTDPQAEVLWAQKTERIELPLEGAMLSLDERRPGFQLHAGGIAARLEDGVGAAPLKVGALADDLTLAQRAERPISIRLASPGEAHSVTIPAGQFDAQSEAGRLVAEGPFRLFVTDARLTYAGATGPTQAILAHFRVEERPGHLYNPVTESWFGLGTHQEYVQEALVVEGTGRLQAQFAGLPGHLYARSLTAEAEGAARFPAATGAVRVTHDGAESEHRLSGQALELGGRYQVRFHDLRGATAQASGSGDLTRVQYGAVTAHYPWQAVAAAVGVGAVALAALAWLGSHAAKLLGGAGGILAGYARVQGEEILEHPGRAEVYERVKAFPGVNFVQLSAQVQFGDSTLSYHLRVLERNGYIASVRDGRYLRFFDKRSGQYAGERKHAVSALRNPTTAAMARHIRENPGIAQCDLAARFRVTPSTVTWHMNRLAAAGLASRSRDGAHTRYYLAEGWAQLPAEEQARQAVAAVA